MHRALLAGLLALAGVGSMISDIHKRDKQPFVAAANVPLEVHVGGRVLTRPTLDRSARHFRFQHQWPGIYFEAAFVGTSVTLLFDDRLNSYRLLVDSRPPMPIVQPGKSSMRVSGLGPGLHRLRLEKVSESTAPDGAFLGFFVERGSKPQRVLPRPRQIEFIGDSSVTGYGVHSMKQACSIDEIRRTTDTQSAYGATVAKHYHADYQINAASARGVVRNYAGILPDETLPKLYPYALLNKTAPYRDEGWKPQIIFIKLNADFVGDLKPGERWKSFGEVAQDYATGLGSFIARIHSRSPAAGFLIWWFDTNEMSDPKAAAAIDQVRQLIDARARQAGIMKTEILPMGNAGLERTACDGHYSIRDHQELARRIIAAIDNDFQSFRAN